MYKNCILVIYTNDNGINWQKTSVKMNLFTDTKIVENTT